MKLNIHMLPFNRLWFLINTIKEISKINDTYKSLFQVIIHSQAGQNIIDHKNILRNSNINFVVLNECGSGEYLPKIKNAIQIESDYSMKLDEDIFITHHVLEFIIDNLQILDDDKVLALTPTLSTGIPSTEMFIEDVFSQSERDIMYDIFKNTHIPNLWGVTYDSLNKERSSWDCSNYYNSVSNICHYYKGIHPIRVNENAQTKMLQIIEGKREKIINKQDYHIQNKIVPYFCNSIFALKTSTWRNIIRDETLYRDPFDEVPLNLYKDKYNLQIGFIRNANSIHPSYNTVVNYMGIASSCSQILSKWV